MSGYDDLVTGLRARTRDHAGSDRQLVADLAARAREIGPALRASTSDRDRLAGWLLEELAGLAERLTAQITEASGG